MTLCRRLAPLLLTGAVALGTVAHAAGVTVHDARDRDVSVSDVARTVSIGHTRRHRRRKRSRYRRAGRLTCGALRDYLRYSDAAHTIALRACRGCAMAASLV